MKLLDVTIDKRWLTLAGHRYPIQGLAFSPDGLRLASSTSRGLTTPRNETEVKLWDLTEGRVLLALPEVGKGDMAFHPDGFHLSNVSMTMDRR